LKIKNFIYLVSCFVFSFAFSQELDNESYQLYKDKIILYADLGYNSAPFSISYPFTTDINRIKYRNNYKTVLGLGGAYKWFSVRIAFALGQNTKSTAKFGATDFRALRASYTYKQTYYELDIRGFKGFAVKNAYLWNDSITPELPNDIRPNTMALGISLNGWYFNNDKLNMNAVYGKRGHYKNSTGSFYIKSSINLYGISNTKRSIIPKILIDSNNTKTATPSLSAFDFGFIPGYAFILKKNNWQLSTLFGLGGVIQNKYYKTNETTRGFIGLAPRYDIITVAGYSSDKHFVFLSADFNNKSIRYNDLIYRQSFYHFKLIGGIRLNKKEKKKNVEN